MKYSTPEKCGISTAVLKKYVDHLEKNGLSTHSLIVMRGDNVVLEKYWAPFHRDFNHRMYSSTKSYTAIGIGLLEEEGKISLDEKLERGEWRFLSEEEEAKLRAHGS